MICRLLSGVILAGLAPAIGLSAAPKLDRLYPAGGQRGTEVVTTCTGEFPWPVKAWAPGVDVIAKEEKGQLSVTIPADLAADQVWIRLFNEEGISAAVPFLIDNLPELSEEEPNNTRTEAHVLEGQRAVVNGKLESGADVDAFVMTLEQGQVLVASIDANRRLGSPMDAILQVVTPDGFVLAENHDDVGLDPRVAYTATESGPHVVRLFAFPSSPNSSIAFNSGAAHIYRLTVTTGPYIINAIPLAVNQADVGEVAVAGWNIPTDAKLPVSAWGNGSSLADYPTWEDFDLRRVAPNFRRGVAFSPEFSGAAHVRLVPHDVAVVSCDGESQDLSPLEAPCAVTGRLLLPGEIDEFRFPLKQGQRVLISVESQNLNLPLSPTVKLTDPSGKVISEVNQPNQPNKAFIAHDIAVDGEYRVTVGEHFRHGGPRYFYGLTVLLEEPNFDLTANVDAIVVSADKPAELEISINRRSSLQAGPGPITIEALGLPAGIVAPPVVSQIEGDTSGKVKMKFSTSGIGYFAGPIRIVGTTNEPEEIRRTVRTPGRLGHRFDAIWVTSKAK